MIMSAAKYDASLRFEDGSAKLPRHVFAHGFFTKEGQKISKSLGNAVSPSEAAQEVGMDALRYYLLREVTLGEDGDFSSERLMDRYNNDLGNTLGNLLQRTVAMSRKYFNGNVPDCDAVLAGTETTDNWLGSEGLKGLSEGIAHAYGINFRPDLALAAIWSGMDGANNAGLFHANKYIEDTQPFKLAKTDLAATGRVLYALLESLRWYAWFLTPVMPKTAIKMFTALGLDSDEEYAKGWDKALTWGQLPQGSALPEPVPMFPRREKESE
jgi:methionyl-tRNA synthetase